MVQVKPGIGVTELEGDEVELLPIALMAFTVNVYATPSVNPVIVQEVAEVVLQCLLVSCTAVAIYPVIAEPPLTPGAVHETVACSVPAVAVALLGAPGTVFGITAAEGEDAGLVPWEFVAVTVKVYEVPFVKPVTTQEVVEVEVQRLLVSCTDLVVYPVMA